MANSEQICLLHLLSNTLVLYQTVPYLPLHSILALGATSKSFRSLIHHTPGVFRHVDLTNFKSTQFSLAAIDHGGEVWRNVQMDENVTEDDFYGGPLMAIFNALSRMEILRDVHTLILDGLSVTSELVREIICEESFNVRVLSIREVQNLNERKLQQALRYSIRPSRAANTPKLEALYIFGPRDAPSSPRMKRHLAPGSSTIASPQTLASHGGVMSSRGAQIGAQWNEMSENALAHDLEKSGDKWYEKSGILFAKPISSEWADTVLSCQGIVSFDAILCNGPRHHSREASANGHNEGSPIPPYRRALAYLPPRLATYSTGGCCKCGSAPEGFSLYGKSSLEALPLLAPPPLHNSSAKSAKVPTIRGSEIKKLLVRCVDCIRARYCEGCHKWWCEDCYEIPEVAVTPVESLQPWEAVGSNLGGQPEKNVKVHMGLCVENCLVAEMMSGAGSNGMWG